MARKRQGNIELLRIVIMFMILVLHANFVTWGKPENSFSAIGLSRNILESLTIIPVNIFVIITGYFGTNLKLRRICSLIFQCFFCVVPISILFIATGIFTPTNKTELIKVYNFLSGYWFIVAYIGLLLFTPILNAAIESFNKKYFLLLIVLLYLFYGIGDYIHINSTAITTNGGYSALWFVILYLTGAYIKRFPIIISKYLCVVIYVVSAISCAVFSIPISFLGISYNNPFVVIASISFFLFFIIGVKNNNKATFWIASSTTMVYLLNSHPIVIKFYKDCFYNFYQKYSLIGFLSVSLLFCIVFFIIAILYDKIRIFLWKHIDSLIFK